MRKYSVPALVEELTQLLQSRYPTVVVEGEVGQMQIPASGHCYLQLRDKGGPKNQDVSLSALVWRDDWNRMSFRPKVGDRVLARGRVSVFAPRAAMQLYVTDLAPAGVGEMQREIEARKSRLMAEGLLDARRKRALPAMPRVVGIATSRTGAALQDFLEVSRQRFPSARIVLAPCLVQGLEAASSVLRAVELLLEHGQAEVIVVTRGGGSKEDLMPFNDEQLARFLAHSPVPVVSAVGHQIDTTIADLVADAVAPTPSAAAMLVFPDGRMLAQRVDEAAMNLNSAVLRRISSHRQLVTALRLRLRHPGERLRDMRRRFIDFQERLLQAGLRPMEPRRAKLLREHIRLHPAIAAQLAQREHKVTTRTDRLVPAIERLLAVRRAKLASLEAQLHALSPLGVLDRGYAIVSRGGEVVTDPHTVPDDAALVLKMKGGELPVRVARPGQLRLL